MFNCLNLKKTLGLYHSPSFQIPAMLSQRALGLKKVITKQSCCRKFSLKCNDLFVGLSDFISLDICCFCFLILHLSRQSRPHLERPDNGTKVCMQTQPNHGNKSNRSAGFSGSIPEQWTEILPHTEQQVCTMWIWPSYLGSHTRQKKPAPVCRLSSSVEPMKKTEHKENL